jgi:hypothetical protein
MEIAQNNEKANQTILMIESFDLNQVLFFVLIMAITAVPVGFVAGLFGIGGGLITVPFLFYIFGAFGLRPILYYASGCGDFVCYNYSYINSFRKNPLQIQGCRL